MKLEIEIHCPECGGSHIWQPETHLQNCPFCGSLLYLELNDERRFYMEPVFGTTEQLRSIVVTWLAEKKKSDDMARYPDPRTNELPASILNSLSSPLSSYVEDIERSLTILESKLIYVPYWLFHGTLYQNILAKDRFESKRYVLRTCLMEDSVPAYGPLWNFRDRGLRFGQARLKETTRDWLSSRNYIAFAEDYASDVDRCAAAVPPAEPLYQYKRYTLVDRRILPVFRPYWRARYAQNTAATAVLVDAIFGTVAATLGDPEAEKMMSYQAKPYEDRTPPAIRVLSSRCPVCGSDCRWGGDLVFQLCGNCRRALVLRSGEFACVDYRILRSDSESSVSLPFWKMQVRLQHKTKTYASLRDYFLQFFPERVLQASYGDSLWIPAFKAKQNENGDEMIATLIANATASPPELIAGPLSAEGDAISGSIDQALAIEMVRCILPAATGTPGPLQKSVILTQMLTETGIEVLGSELVWLGFQKAGSEIVVGKRRFAMNLIGQS